MASESSDRACSGLPTLVASFVDAFVDFSVSGLFFPANPKPRSPTPPTRLPEAGRLVAVGDLHGDLPKTLAALAVAGLADPATGRWTGGRAVAVQVGDVLDRGGDELRLLHLLHRLKAEAAAAGGAFLTLHGNHEIMGIDGDFRYATPAGLAEFENWAFWFRSGLAMKRLCDGLEGPKNPFIGVPKSFPGVKKEFWEGIRARIAALRPDGPISGRFLSGNQAILVVGDSVFVHGGLLQRHVNYGLEKINDEVRDWVLGRNGRRSPDYMRGRNSVVWLRKFSEGQKCDCRHLKGVLSMIPGAKRMVMGHTIQQEGINGVCRDQAIRIDVGLSRGCSDGVPAVLEINGSEELKILMSNPMYYRARKQRPAVREEAKEGLAMLVKENRFKEVEVNA